MPSTRSVDFALSIFRAPVGGGDDSMKFNAAWMMLAGSLIVAEAVAQDSYLCIEDMATGFKYDKEKQKWDNTSAVRLNKPGRPVSP
jgi:hypothetical protein